MSQTNLDTKFKIIKRFDSYYTSINNKSSFLLAYNTFVIGYLLTNYSNLSYAICYIKIFTSIYLSIIIISVISLFLTILTISPFLKSFRGKDKNYKSLLFFKSISEMKEDEFYKEINKLDENNLSNYLNTTIYNLSGGLTYKFTLSKSAFILNLIQLFLFILLIVLFIL